MARDLILTTEVIAGKNHPNFPDSKNPYLEQIWADYTEGHNEDGTQKDPYEIWALQEPYTYTGTGAVLSVAWQGTTFTQILMLLIWSEDNGELYFTTTGGYTKQASDGTVLTNAVTAIDTDGFTLGVNAGVNTNTTVYYYYLLALGTTPDVGSNASPPPWIADSTACLGGVASTMANDVEDDLDTKFLVKHTIDTGAHDDSEFDDLMSGETGTFTPDGTVSQVLTLTKTALDVKAFWLWDTGTGGYNRPAFMGEGFANLREYTATALTGSSYVTPGTGQVAIDTSKMQSAATTILDVNSDTTDGDTVIVDSSAFANPIYNPSGAGSALVTHSTDQSHSGATSLKFDAAAAVRKLLILGDGFTLAGNFDINFEVFLAATITNLDGWFFNWLSTSGFGGGQGQQILIYFKAVAATWVIEAVLYDDDANTVTVTATTAIDDGAWHNISLSRTSGLIDLKIDTVSEDTDTLVGTLSDLDYLIIGKDARATTDPWYLDDMQIDAVLPYFTQNSPYRYIAIGEE